MLNGVRVIDLTSVVFGPYATKLIADLGAEVIKIEPPAGDQFRYAGRPAVTRGMGHGHMTLNGGKKSVVLDLKEDADKQAMRALLETADVFIHNVRAKAIAKLGFSYDDVKAINPNIIYVHCVGFGGDGPYADKQAYDDVIQAATGTATLLPRADGDERPRYFPSLIADKVAGLHGAYAILAALVHKLRTGAGQFVEAPMFEAFTNFMLLEHFGGAVFDPPTGPWGYPRQLDPARQPFKTKDGYIAIVPYTDESIGTVFDVLGEPTLLNEPRFATPKDRAQNMSAVYAEIDRFTRRETTAFWMEKLSARQIPAMPVRDLSDMLDDPHLQAVNFFQARTHPTEGGYFTMQPPIKFSAMPEVPCDHPPTIGQHTKNYRP